MAEGGRTPRVSTQRHGRRAWSGTGRAGELGRVCLGPGMADPLTQVSLEPVGKQHCRQGLAGLAGREGWSMQEARARPRRGHIRGHAHGQLCHRQDWLGEQATKNGVCQGGNIAFFMCG